MTDTHYPRKVLHVLNSAGGGAALSTLALIESLRGHGVEACVVCHTAGSADERRRVAEAARGQVLFTPLYWWNKKIRAKTWNRPIEELRQLVSTGWTKRSTALVADFALRHNAEVIHSNSLTILEGGLASRRLGLPHVWHVRELVGKGTPYPLRLEGRALGQYLADHCTRLVANSEASAQPLRGLVPADRLTVVPNGIDISPFKFRGGPAQPDRTVVAMVGNLSAQTKKHALFIDAAILVDSRLPIEWRIYGHVPSQGAYVQGLHERINYQGLTEKFKFPGFVANPAEIMQEIDLLVHPADNESFGRVAVEAMAAGLPVVSVRGGGIGEIVVDGMTGLLAEPDDSAGLARCIEQLVRNPEQRQAFGAAGRRRAETRYSLDVCTAGVLGVYEQILRSGATRVAPLGGARVSI